MARLLLLGGTHEALKLARALAPKAEIQTITSLAGRTRTPAETLGEVRVGGFGGAEGLARFLEVEAVDLVVDATHPFAAIIARNAAQACRESGVPRLKLLRPAWKEESGDRWTGVESAEQAAGALTGLAKRVFLTVGHRELRAFSRHPEVWYLVRLIDPPDHPLPLARHELVLGRGPFAEADEIALMRSHRIEALVAKNSGGELTYAKIAAARRLGLPVVMLRRPAAPPGETVETVDQALAWIAAHTGSLPEGV
jgi:precorrin-6A/cobalt-precorrin-6A reductase